MSSGVPGRGAGVGFPRQTLSCFSRIRCVDRSKLGLELEGSWSNRKSPSPRPKVGDPGVTAGPFSPSLSCPLGGPAPGRPLLSCPCALHPFRDPVVPAPLSFAAGAGNRGSVEVWAQVEAPR